MKPLHLICCLVLCLSTQSCVIVGVQASFPPSLTIRLDYEYLKKRAEDLGKPFPKKSFTLRRSYTPKAEHARSRALLGIPVGAQTSADVHTRRIRAAQQIQARRLKRGF